MKPARMPLELVVNVAELQPSFPFDRRLDHVEAMASRHHMMFNLHLGNLCNQTCIYCDVPREDSVAAAPEDIRRSLALAASRGLKKLVLIGGEPTVRADLHDIVRTARAQGFDEVLVMTNGLRLADGDALDALVDSGVTTIHLSLDDFDPGVQGRLASNPKNGPRVVAALEQLVARPDLDFYLYAVLTRLNLPHLRRYVEEVATFSASRGAPIPIVFTNLKPETYALRNRDTLLPRAVEAAAAVRDALGHAERLGVPLIYRELPACLMGGFEAYALEGYYREFRLDLETGQRLPSRRDPRAMKGPECPSCRWDPHCHGVHRAYASEAGWGEFRPVPPPRADADEGAGPWYQARPGRAVVVGGTGFLGTHAARELSRAGWDVTSLSRHPPAPEDAVDGVRYVHGDRADGAVLADLLAGAPDLWVDTALFGPGDAEALVAAWSPDLPTRFVVAGAVAEYAKRSGPPPALDEGDALDPSDAYGRGKVDAFRTLERAARDRGFPFAWGVISQLWGPGDPSRRERRVRRVVLDILDSRPVLLADDDGHTLATDGFVRTVAEALLHVAGDDTLLGRRVNLGGLETVTPRLFVEVAADALDRPATLLSAPREVIAALEAPGAFRYENFTGASDLLVSRRRLESSGFVASTSALDGIREAARWYAAQPRTPADQPELDSEALARLADRPDVASVSVRPFGS